MTAIQLKSEFHHLIDGVKDSNQLKDLYKMVHEYLFKKGETAWEDIPSDLKHALEDGIKQADNGQLVPYDKVKKEIKKRFSI